MGIANEDVNVQVFIAKVGEDDISLGKIRYPGTGRRRADVPGDNLLATSWEGIELSTIGVSQLKLNQLHCLG